MLRFLLFSGLSFSLFISSSNARTEATLSLNDYLNQVREQNGTLKAAELRESGYKKSERESALFFTPRLVGELRRTSDASLPDQPGFEYAKIKSELYTLGLEQRFPFGLEAQLGFDLSKLEFVDAAFGGAPAEFKVWDAAPRLGLSLPLWRNAFGREFRATRDITLEENRLEGYSAQRDSIQIMIDANLAYWRLTTAREKVRIQEEAFKRAEALLKFVSGKERLDLRERSDVLQTKASVEASRLDLQLAKDEQRSALLLFNKLRNRPADANVENLNPLRFETVRELQVPVQRPGDRLDVKASQSQFQLSRLVAQSAEERSKPDVSLFGSYALNGRSDEMSDSISEPWKANRPTQTYGVRLSVPLAFGAQSAALEGARARKYASEISARQRSIDQELEWAELRSQFSEAQERARISETIAKAQEAKLQEEKRRLRLGRASLFNVLLFEQDYLRAELERVRSAYTVIDLKLQSELYVPKESL